MNQQLPKLVLGCVLFSCILSLRAETQTLILPREAMDSFGESAGENTFSRLFGRRFRQFYAASEFGGVASDAFLITGVSLRLDPSPDGALYVMLQRLKVSAAIFEGSMEQAFRSDLNDALINASTVLSLTNYNWRAENPKEPKDFTANLSFSRPFLYSPRGGQLALGFDITYPSQGVERAFDSHVTGLRGVQIYTHEGDVLRGGKTLATRFFFKPVDVRIDSVRSENNSVLIEFTNSEPELGRLENAEKIEGPYFPAAEMTLMTNGPTRFTARIPVNTPTRFYRLRLNQP